MLPFNGDLFGGKWTFVDSRNYAQLEIANDEGETDSKASGSKITVWNHRDNDKNNPKWINTALMISVLPEILNYLKESNQYFAGENIGELFPDEKFKVDLKIISDKIDNNYKQLMKEQNG